MQSQNAITLHHQPDPTIHVGATLAVAQAVSLAQARTLQFPKLYRANYSLFVQNTAHPQTSSIPKIIERNTRYLSKIPSTAAKQFLFPQENAF